MTKKEIAFLAFANISAILLVMSLMYGWLWIVLIAFFVYIGSVIFLAALPSSIWISLFFLGLWFLLDLISSYNGLVFLFTFGLPTILLFITVKKNFKLRIKIAFQESVIPALNRFLLLSLLMFSFYLAIYISDESIKQTIKNLIPEKISISGQEINTANSLDNILNENINDLIDTILEQKKAEMMFNCGNDEICKQTIEKNFAIDYQENISEILNSENSTEQSNKNIVDKIFDDLNSQLGITTSQLSALLLFLTLAPFTFLVSYILAIFYGIIYSLLKMFRVLNLAVKQVDKEVLV